MKPTTHDAKLLMLSAILILFLTLISTGQVTPTPTPPVVEPTPTGKVVVDQEFVDDANRAFTELPALRDALEKSLKENKLSLVEREAAEKLILGINQLLDIKNLTIDSYKQLVLFQQQMLAFQQDMLIKFKEFANKPKSFIEKMLKGALEVLKAATFILVGKGLGGI